MFLYFSIVLATLSNVLYHVFQKSISPAVDPIISLIVTYGTALVMLGIALPFYPLKNGVTASFKELNWASFALALGIIGVELAYLLIYRTGWKLSLASPIVMTSTAVILLPIGLLFFHETLSPVKFIGLMLCLGGIILINK